jgi:hypothetical protein
MSRLTLAAALLAGLLPTLALAAGPVELSIKDHRFDPAEIHLPANQPAELHVRNLDATPEEFESSALKIEKIIAGNGEAVIRIRPLAPGRYKFVGEYHEDTAQGVIVAE